MSRSMDKKAPDEDEGVAKNPTPEFSVELDDSSPQKRWVLGSQNKSDLEGVRFSGKRPNASKMTISSADSTTAAWHELNPHEKSQVTELLDRSLKSNREDLDQTIDQVSTLTQSVAELEATQKELNDHVAGLSSQFEEIDAVEVELNEFKSEISERITQLEHRIEDMERAAQGEKIDIEDSYPSFAAFSLRAALAALLFIILFGSFYTQGLIGGLLFGGLTALLVVVGLGSGLAWYQFKG